MLLQPRGSQRQRYEPPRPHPVCRGGNGAEGWHAQHTIDAAAINKTKAEGKQVCFCIGGPKTSSHAGGSHSGSPPGSSYQHGGSSYAHGGSSYAHGGSAG